MILSVIRFGIADAEPAYMIEKGWAAYRKQQGLDLCGKSLATRPADIVGCVHPQVSVRQTVDLDLSTLRRFVRSNASNGTID
jgi:hypothetical protein